MDSGHVKALKYLIRASPSGEMQDVIHHMAVLAGGMENLQSSQEIAQALQKWYETHRYHATLPDGRQGLITAACICGGDGQSRFTYYDAVLGLSFSFNVFTQATEIISEEPMHVATSPLRESLVTEMRGYVEKSFRKGKALFAVQQPDESNPDHQVIEISCHNVKLDSFWSGEWQSTFTLNNGQLSGELKVRCHYFEQGNMQFNLDKTWESIAVKDATDAASIVKAIHQTEEKVSAFLFNPFCSTNFRSMTCIQTCKTT